MIIFLSVKCFAVFFFMKLLIGYLKRFPLEMGKGQMGKNMYAMKGEGLSKHTSVFDDGERGQIFTILVFTY